VPREMSLSFGGTRFLGLREVLLIAADVARWDPRRVTGGAISLPRQPWAFFLALLVAKNVASQLRSSAWSMR
jgi:hypothetical protein